MALLNSIIAIKKLINKLFFLLTKKQKKMLPLVVILMVFNSLLQTLGISAVVPLVIAMTNKDDLMRNPIIICICSVLGITSFNGVLIMICVAIAMLYLLKNAIGVFQNYVSVRYSNKVNRELSTMVLETYMNRDYDFFLDYGTSKVMRDVSSDPSSVNTILIAFFSITTEVLTVVMIITYIVASDLAMALCIMLIAILCMFIIYHYFKPQMVKCGRKFRASSAETNKVLLQAVQGIKEVQVMRKQKYFVKRYCDCYSKQQEPGVVQQVASTAPKYVVEGLFVLGIMIFLPIRIIINPEYVKKLPVLASFIVGAIRMLPSLGRISSEINVISYNIPFLESAYQNLRNLKELCKTKEILVEDYDGFQDNDSLEECVTIKKIVMEDISYSYPESNKKVLDSLSLTISKGQSIGIIGQSGAGKSTLADVILGLHKPNEGRILLDGRDILDIPEVYGKIIGFVPQQVYLIDGSVRENVAFGVREDNIDDDCVWDCLEKAQLADYFRAQETGINTVVGEAGVKLSGGQRQRIAIARALYRKPQILVLDEATSALDNETEEAVMEAIENLYGKITLIIIAHRLSTVRSCDEIYEISEGKALLRDKSDVLGQ